MNDLKLACIDSHAPPLFDLSPDGGRTRTGYEPEVAAMVAQELGLEPTWMITSWDTMIPMVQRHEADAVWCGQGIIPSRQEQLDFTRPYAIFDESVLVRAGDPARGPGDFSGRRVAAIAGSANMQLAETFPGAITVAFTASDDVFGDMITAVRNGSVDAMVDDDVVTVPLGEDPDFDIAFTSPTQNAWGVGVAKDRPELLESLNAALSRLIDSGELQQAWNRWMPQLAFPADILTGRPS
ncbi:substrate-binding periplasmic protein [Nesterenkonia haasae]|uniref:substrate-binding periplasmic protein n=1 Tax=Nesterenkonia haasae TaxID=2587813 RepID=UPI0013916D34|nr:ABC transporter substrate-binding protein [Nesterenkonia haasae]NDK32170.1 amino acid ABC transporter substrate-binding protein [Nesterenkonia haasae]